MASLGEQTAQDLQRRFGSMYDLATLARFCGVKASALREQLEQSGVPVLDIGRKRIVVRELADRVLGLDIAETFMEIKQNEEAMRRLEYLEDGTRKTVAEYAEESSARVREAIEEYQRKRAGEST